jgi:hypothetical protein
MMFAGTLVVSVIAVIGWLFLNWRALQSHGLSFEQKAAMAVAWVVIFAVLTFVLTRMGF